MEETKKSETAYINLIKALTILEDRELRINAFVKIYTYAQENFFKKTFTLDDFNDFIEKNKSICTRGIVLVALQRLVECGFAKNKKNNGFYFCNIIPIDQAGIETTDKNLLSLGFTLDN